MKTRAGIIAWIESALNVLSISENHGRDYVRLKILFYRYHASFIFSTRMFDFEDILFHLKNNIEVKAMQNEDGRLVLSEYDRNFNLWMASLK